MAYAKGGKIHFPNRQTISGNHPFRKSSTNVRVVKHVEIPILHKHGYTAEHVDVQFLSPFSIRILVHDAVGHFGQHDNSFLVCFINAPFSYRVVNFNPFVHC